MVNSRAKGHTWERQVAAYLRDHGWPSAVSTRSRLRDQQGDKQVPGGDIADGPCVIECKNEARWRPDAWIAQAVAEADGRRCVVVAKRANCPPDDAWVLTPSPRYGWTAVRFGAWIVWEAPTSS